MIVVGAVAAADDDDDGAPTLVKMIYWHILLVGEFYLSTTDNGFVRRETVCAAGWCSQSYIRCELFFLFFKVVIVV